MQAIYNICDFGANGDGKFKNTEAIQNAIEKCAQDGGGTVYFPPGTYVSGTIYLRSNVSLNLTHGAVLEGSPDREDYNADDFCPQNRVFAKERVSGAHLLVALEVEGISICGGGRIDGACRHFMTEPEEDFPAIFKRPEWRPAQMLFICECRNVTLENVELFNAPYWTCFLHGCQDVVINGLRIWNDQRTPNGDGIDVDCCQRVTISNCHIDGGDDCITLRANAEPLTEPRVCEHVTVTNCILRTTRCNAIRVGVGNGTIRDCVFSNIIIRDTRTGICIVSEYSGLRQVQIQRILFQNMIMDTKRLFVITSNIKGPQDEPSKLISGISFQHLSGRSCRTSLIQGNTDCNTKNIKFVDADFEYYGGSEIPEDRAEHEKVTGETSYIKSTPAAFCVRNAEKVEFRDVNVTWTKDSDPRWEKAIDGRNAKNLLLEKVREQHEEC